MAKKATLNALTKAIWAAKSVQTSRDINTAALAGWFYRIIVICDPSRAQRGWSARRGRLRGKMIVCMLLLADVRKFRWLPDFEIARCCTDLHQLDESALEHNNTSRTSTHTTPSPLGEHLFAPKQVHCFGANKNACR
ncbi:TPA: hypothetical protein ACH3X2_002087 [Trebouxia sp. C0005]